MHSFFGKNIPNIHDEKNNSISLEDFHRGYKNNYNSLILHTFCLYDNNRLICAYKTMPKLILQTQGKPIAFSYAKAVLGMLPTTPYIPHDPVSHESINDLPVHRATEIQIFHPVSESRHFTRRDAGKVFDRELKPAEDRVPHTELVQLQKWAHEGKIEEERIQLQRKKDAKDVESRKVFERKRREKEARDVKKVETERSMYRFQDIRVESVGYTGRGKEGVGARYGIAHQDRKKGQIKIPTSVR